MLGDVRHAVADWRPMRDQDRRGRWPSCGPAPRSVPAEQRAEARGVPARGSPTSHFTLLGYSAYALEDNADGVQLRRVKGTGLGILRAKDDGALSQSFAALPAEIRGRAREPLPLLTITKANTRSTVHRGTYLDFIGVKRFAPTAA